MLRSHAMSFCALSTLHYLRLLAAIFALLLQQLWIGFSLQIFVIFGNISQIFGKFHKYLGKIHK